MTPIAIRMHLSTMIRDDPNGSDAALLLSRLVVFVNTFDQGVIASMAQDLFTPSQRRVAFATLQQWSFVVQTQGKQDQRVDQLADQMAENDFFGTLQSQSLLDQEIVEERFRLNEGVAQTFVPDPQAAALHYEHYLALYRQPDPLTHKQFKHDWPNVVIAIEWGYRHQPETMLILYRAVQSDLIESIKPELASKLARYACKVARLVGNAEEEARLLEALAQHASYRQHIRCARRYYRIALGLYETKRLDNFFAHSHLLDILANLSVDLSDYTGARHFYETLLPFYKNSQPLETYIGILLKLNALAFTYDDLPAARHYGQEILRLLDLRSRIAYGTLRDLGMFYAKINDEANAQRCYASAYALADTIRANTDFEILIVWGAFERKCGHLQLACHLIALSISALRLIIDQRTGSNEAALKEIDDLLKRQQHVLMAMQGDEGDP